jgi:hypothetical protein
MHAPMGPRGSVATGQSEHESFTGFADGSPANPRRYGFDGSCAKREIATAVQLFNSL